MEALSLNIEEFIKLKDEGYLVLDMRDPDTFSSAFIPGSLNLAMDDDFSDLARYFIFKSEKLLVIAEPGWEDYCTRKLKALNYKNVGGYLAGGMKTWQENNRPVDVVISIDTDELAIDIKYDKQIYLDIRSFNDYEKSHLEGSDNIEPIVLIEDPDLIVDKEIVCIYCSNGKLSMSLISYLKIQKKHNVHHIRGGYREIESCKELSKLLKRK